jgi:hypothetical protein
VDIGTNLDQVRGSHACGPVMAPGNRPALMVQS